jgi:predicted nucleic acid-binding protein
LRIWIADKDGQIIASDLVGTELLRAVRRVSKDDTLRAKRLLDRMILLKLSSDICDRAGLLEAKTLRSLDAIHLATAIECGSELGGIVSYDDRLIGAAVQNGIETFTP